MMPFMVKNWFWWCKIFKEATTVCRFLMSLYTLNYIYEVNVIEVTVLEGRELFLIELHTHS